MIPDRRRQHFAEADKRHLDRETVRLGLDGIERARQALRNRQQRLEERRS